MECKIVEDIGVHPSRLKEFCQRSHVLESGKHFRLEMEPPMFGSLVHLTKLQN